MAKRIEWTVRIIIHYESGIDQRHAGRDGWWLGEALRYAGLSARLAEFSEPNRREVFELYAPRGVEPKVWADQNAARLRSFGVDAAAAPRWSALTYFEQSDEQRRMANATTPAQERRLQDEGQYPRKS